jgi:UDP-arabinose 4-epimerase
MDKNILVTGGAGYIGSHTCKALAIAGYNPIVYDNLTQGFKHNVKWGELHVGDVCDKTKLVSILKENKIQYVIHFAGSAYVGESMKDPAKYFNNNTIGTLNLLQAMREANAHGIIFSSSCTTYGIPTIIPIPVSHSQNPINPYGWSKLMAEQMIQQIGDVHEIRYSILRYFNAAGADPEGELREEHNPETHLIPLAVRSAFDENSPLHIYGTDYPTKDGTCIRDYIHVSTLADAHVESLKRLEKGSHSEILNLGTGKGFSVKDIVKKIEDLTGHKLPIIESKRRLGDPPILIAETDHVDKFSNLEQIVLSEIKSQQ